MNKNCFLILLLLLIFHSMAMYAGEKPVVSVLEFSFKGKGIKKSDVSLLVEIMSHTLMETDLYYVIGKRERNRLLKAYNYVPGYLADPKNYKELGEKLFSDVILGGDIIRKNEKYIFTIHVFDVSSAYTISSIQNEYHSVKEIIDNSRIITGHIVKEIARINYRKDLISRIVNTLSPVTLKERILFILQRDILTDKQAKAKKMSVGVLSYLLKEKRFITYTKELDYDEENIDTDQLHQLVVDWDCHYVILMEKNNEHDNLVIYGENSERLFSVQLGEDDNGYNDPEKIAEKIEKELNPLPIETVTREIKENIAFEKKLTGLLFSEKLLSYKITLSIFLTLLKSIYVYAYVPAFSILSLEGNIVWYYKRMIGAGIGYGYALNYPGTIDEELSAHPLVHQHEIRLIPFSLRTGGPIGFVLQLLSTLNIHNAKYVNTESEPITFGNEMNILFSKIGINIGLHINFSEYYALYWNGITFNYAIPIGDHYNYPDDEDLQKIRPFSLDIGSLGFSFRF